MGQCPGYHQFISKEKNLWSLKLLFDLAGSFSVTCCFLLENVDFPSQRFLRNIPVLIRIFLRNFPQLQYGLSGKRHCALLQNSKWSSVPVNTKNQNGSKVKSLYAAVRAKDMNLRFHTSCRVCQVVSHFYMVPSAKFLFKLPTLMIE